MVKAQRSNNTRTADDRTKNLSKQALDSLLSRNKNSQFAPDMFPDSSDLEKLNDDHQSEDSEDQYDYEDEGSIHPISSGTDPNVLLHALTNSQKHQIFSDEISHFSNPHINPVTRKIPIEDSKHLSVPLPGPPKAIQAAIVKPRFVTLNWLEPLENPDEVVSYTVYYKMNTNDARYENKIFKTRIPSKLNYLLRERKINTNSRDEQEVNVQSLLPGKTYHFRVVANSNHGQGESSEILEIATQPEENIAGAPENLQVAAISHNEIYLKWDPPKGNGVILKYRVFFAEGEHGDDQSADTTSTEFMLTQLRAYTEYTISVVSINQNGIGNPTEEKLVKTFSNTPSEAPSNFTLEASSSSVIAGKTPSYLILICFYSQSIIIRWEPPSEEERNGPLTGYKIKYRKMKKSGIHTETTPGNVKFYELKNLDRMSAYQIKIAAMTVNGTGPFNEWTNIETFESDLDESLTPGEPGWIRKSSTLCTRHIIKFFLHFLFNPGITIRNEAIK